MQTRPTARDFALWLVLVPVILLGGCSRELEVQIGVPAARDFETPVPVMVADVQIGITGDTGLGPDDRPMVIALIDAQYKDRITRQSEFVIRRKNFGLGPRILEVIPGDGAPAPAGHHFVARTDSRAADAQAWWNDLLERTHDPELDARLERLRDRFTEMVDASRENWEEARPELEAESRQILDRLGEESTEAAAEFRRWLDEQWKATERRVPE